MLTVRTLCLIFAVAGACPHTASSSSFPNSEDAWRWVEEVRPTVEQSLTGGLGVGSSLGFAGALEWQLVVTAHDGWGLSWKAFVQKSWEGEIRGHYFEFLGANLERQLYRQRRADAELSLTDALNRMRIASGTVESKACATLSLLAGRFEELVVPAVPDTALRLHAWVYNVRVTAASGETREYTVYADEGPLATWCERLLVVLRECN